VIATLRPIAVTFLIMFAAGCAGGGQPAASTPAGAAKPVPTTAPAAAASPPATAASPLAASSPAAAGVTVKMGDTVFIPDQITVPVGTTVTWDNADLSTHTVTADDGSFDSGSDPAKWLGSGQKFSFTFSRAGTFTYHCIPHQTVGMVGTVVVS
jgi:plastocyanin